MPALADLQRVESHLTKLGSVDCLRRLLADLDYRVGDEPVSTSGWKSDLAAAARDGTLGVLARHDDFVVTYCRLPELRLTREREMVTKLVRQYDRGLFVFADHTDSRWHFINVKLDSRRHNRLVLRRIAVGPEEQLRTAIERIALLKVGDASWSGLGVELRHEEAFDVEKVTEQFYRGYKDLPGYKQIFDHISDRLQHQVNLRTARAFAQQFMNRMMFLYFLQKKGWLGGRRDFVRWLWQRYQDEPAARRVESSTQGSFYTRYLYALFFQALNSPSDDLTPGVPKQQLYARRGLPDDIKQVFAHLPYLNGGLFSILPGIDDQGLAIEDSEFENLFENLLEHYNFTVGEDTPLDVEVAVNPEMLGKVYESLVLEEERGQAGIFYTPRVELDFMCRRSLIEYLDEEPIIDRSDLIRLVMNADSPDPDNPESIPTLPPERWRQIRRKLEEIAVVDPACGSGAFLVGMMQVVSGLHRLICARLEEPYHDFQVKKRIIGENLFGVDIKDWAVRVAELRLWLSLITHASLDEVQQDPGRSAQADRPILPNLTFRIQVGDSLVEEIAGRSLSLRGRYSQLEDRVKRQVSGLVNRKMDYFYNRGEVMPRQDIRRLETEVFRAILNDELAQIDGELRRLRAPEQEAFQHELDMARAGGPARLGGPVGVGAAQVSPEKARLRQQIERLEQERASVIAVRDSQDIERGKGSFLWDIEYAEVFQRKGGFDIVIGNPPYVRQEEIVPLSKDSASYTPDQWLEEKRRYKEALQRSVQTHWGSYVKVGGRADYYIYFYLHGLALLRPSGTFCFITSNSWLDVGYGADLQQFLLTNIEIKDIYDNHAKRSFASSDINTVIVLFRRPTTGADLSGHTARFVAFKRPFEAVLTADNLTLIEWADSIQRTDDFRVYPLSQAELWQAGLEQDEEEARPMPLGLFGHGRYAGDKWGGKYLRAPDIFFTILEKGKGKLVHLGDIAEVRRGFTTGANEFFYLEALTPGPSPNAVGEGRALRPGSSPSAVGEGVAYPPDLRPSRELIQLARELRQRQTPAEELLWQCLRNRQLGGFKFRRQHPLGKFIADFFCDDARLLIEIDGAIHQEPSQQERDRLREEVLRYYGLACLRFTNNEVLTQTEKVLERILEVALRRSYERRGALTPGPSPSTVGEGEGLIPQTPSPEASGEGEPRSGGGEGKLLRVRNGAGWEGFIEEEFLKPVVKSPREIKTILIRPEDLKYKVFMCHLSKAELQKQGKTHALEYIKWGEGQESKGHQDKQKAGIPFPQLQSFVGRTYWFAIPPKEPCHFLCNRFFNDRLFFAFPELPSLEDQTFYGGRFREPAAIGAQLAVLNSTVEALFGTLLGRVALGEGVLQYAVYEMEQLIALRANTLTPAQRKRLEGPFDQIAGREIKSIFEELGLPKPNRDYSNIRPEDVRLDAVLPDRRELDRVVFEVLELSEEEQLEVYRAVVELVKDRLSKARSLQRPKARRAEGEEEE